MQAGVPGGQRGRAGAQRSANTCVLANTESATRVPALVTFHLCQPAAGDLAVCVLPEPYTWVLLEAVHGLEEAATFSTSFNTLLSFQTAGGISDLCI